MNNINEIGTSAAGWPALDMDVEATVDAVLKAGRLLLAISPQTVVAADESMTLPQLRLLARLHFDGPRTVGGLARSVGLHPSTVSRTVSALIDAGWAVKQVDPRHRRGTLIIPTRSGEHVVYLMLDYRRLKARQIVEHMSQNDRRELMGALNAFKQSADAAQPETPVGPMHAGRPPTSPSREASTNASIAASP